MNDPVLLVVLDGFGINPKKEGNAIALAKAPTFRKLEQKNMSQIQTSGLEVGLPKGIMGNSEVGHTNLGAGRIVYQDSVRINLAIETGDFFKNGTLMEAFRQVQEEKTKLHVMGLLSDGGVHSFDTHLFAFIQAAKQNAISKLYLHLFLDGRDSPPTSSQTYVERLNKILKTQGVGKIATVSGRYYAMDRDQRWERTEKAYVALTQRKGFQATSAKEAIDRALQRGETDEFVQPTIVLQEGTIAPEDTVIFFNFRPDRARQLTRCFTETNFDFFLRPKPLKPAHFISMTQYDVRFQVPVLFPPVTLSQVLGEVISKQQAMQLRIAETEKYAHVTYFFNGGIEKPFPGEERILMPSVREVPTYDLKPEMSAFEITTRVIENIQKKIFQFILVNFANADMVGHTGNLKATIQAVEVLDRCMEKMIEVAEKFHYHLLITADHGNAEKMMDEAGNPHTAHTTFPVPFFYIPARDQKVKLKEGRLSDFSPTILPLLGFDVPKEMTGENLILASS
ncbi:MAG: 2,3-bisphosphoglycerate-independent phosphoglycerate mutase [Deltaproteobacteria bacterium]|nr:2,3-bisphosphoglycerate-independent phosphoglycerate mutase [Deltaproteobacteria bacterium]